MIASIWGKRDVSDIYSEILIYSIHTILEQLYKICDINIWRLANEHLPLRLETSGNSFGNLKKTNVIPSLKVYHRDNSVKFYGISHS